MSKLRQSAAAVAAFVLAIVGAVVFQPTPQAAATTSSVATRARQEFYAYTSGTGTLTVGGTFQNRSQASTVMKYAQIRVTSPGGTQTLVQASYDGGSDVTLFQAGIPAGGVAGVWKIGFYTTNTAGFNGTVSALNSAISGWQVTPHEDGSAKPGRVWSQKLGLAQVKLNGLANPQNMTIWNLSQDGVLYKNTYVGYMGLWSNLFTNNVGVAQNNGKCTPFYGSANVHDSSKISAENCAPNVFRLFLEEPDPDLPETARMGSTTTWVYPKYVAPSIDEPQFEDARAYDAVTGVNFWSGRLSAKVHNQTGNVTFLIDTDNDGRYDGDADVELAAEQVLTGGSSAFVSAGTVMAGETATVVWDGRDGLGRLVDRRSGGFSVKAVLANVGEIHFLREDVEISSGGLQVEQLSGPGSGAQALSWNDSMLESYCWKSPATKVATCNGGIPSLLRADRVSSAGGVHRWAPASGDQGAWGDERLVNDWTYINNTKEAESFITSNLDLVAPLRVQVSDGVTAVPAGGETTYTVSTTNTSSWISGSNSTIVAHLPQDTVFADASDGGVYDPDSRTITWNAVNIAPSTTKKQTFTVTVPKNVVRPAALDTYATAQPDGDDPPTPPSEECEGDLCAVDRDTVPAAALTITKTDERQRVTRGDELTYTLTAHNKAAADELETLISDRLPAETTFVSATDGGVYDEASHTVWWPRVRLAAGATTTRTVTAAVSSKVARPTTIVNKATITGTAVTPIDPDVWCEQPVCADDSDTTEAATITISSGETSQARRRMTTMTAGTATVTPLQNLTYKINVTNNSTWQDESGITVVDRLPAETTFVSASDGGIYDADSHTVTWSGLNIEADTTTPMNVVVQVKADVARPTEFTNYATASLYDQPGPKDPAAEGCVSPLCVAETSQVPAAELSITQTDTHTLVEPGDQVTHTITAANHLTDAAERPTITATVPAGAVFVSASEGGTYNPDSRTVTWEAFEIGASSAVELQVVTSIDSQVARPTNLTHFAAITAPGSPIPDPQTVCEAPLCAADVNRTAIADLRIVKTVVDAAVKNDGTLAWLIQIGNFSSEQRARDVVVTDVLPADIDLDTVTASFRAGQDPVGEWAGGVWTVGELAPGARAEILITGTIDSPQMATDDQITNQATITSFDDPGKGAEGVCADNDTLDADTDGCDTVTVYPGTALSVVIDDAVTKVRRGQKLHYSVVAVSTADVIENAALLKVWLPPNTTFVSAADGGVYDEAGHTVAWPKVKLAPGEIVTRTFTATVNASAVSSSEVEAVAGISGAATAPPDPTVACEAPTCDSDIDKVLSYGEGDGAGGSGGIDSGLIAGVPVLPVAAGILIAVVGAAVLVGVRRGGYQPRRAYPATNSEK